MQPRWRHVPPTLSISTTATDMPAAAPYRAAAYPPGPPPITTRSNFSAMAGAYRRPAMWESEALLLAARRPVAEVISPVGVGVDADGCIEPRRALAQKAGAVRHID